MMPLEPYKPDDYPKRGPFDIPPRTKAHISHRVTLTAEQAAALARGESFTLQQEPDLVAAPVYICMDCRCTTRGFADAAEHQDNQALYHTWAQRLHRWWAKVTT